MRQWIKYPEIMLSTSVGEVRAAFTNGSHVAVDPKSVTYKGVEYVGMMHLYADGDSGPWTPREKTGDYLRRASDWKDAPRTYAAAIRAAMVDAVRAYVAEHPEVLRDAEYADANNALSRLEDERAEAAEKLAEVDAEIAAVEARLSRVSA